MHRSVVRKSNTESDKPGKKCLTGPFEEAILPAIWGPHVSDNGVIMSCGTRNSALARLSVVVFFAGLGCHTILGQSTFKAQLRGTVVDQSEAVVAHAVVTVTNEATKVSDSTESDGEGRYIFPALSPASYEVTAEAKGFKITQETGVVLRVGQQSVLDLKLEVGEISTKVEVSTEPLLLNSASADLGQEVTSRYVTEVPLLDRDLSKLVYLAPGVTESQGYAADQTHENFVSNGQRNSSAEFRLDGGSLSTPEAGEGGMFWSHFTPSIEIIQEFKVQTNGFSAEYGSNGGTVINAVTKSGSDNFHGSGYWFGRRSATDANDFFLNAAGKPKPDFGRDQYGGTIGGPILKQKLFFFFNYDRTRNDSPFSVNTTVPTDLQRQGDFSQTYVIDPASGKLVLDTIYNPFDTYKDSSGNVKRRPFAGNSIPTSLQDPIALKLLALYPKPTSAGDPGTGAHNFVASYIFAQPTHQYNAKIDYVISPTSTLTGRYSKGYLRRTAPQAFLGDLGQGDETNDYHNFVMQYDHSFNSTTTLTLRGAADRHYQLRGAPGQVDPTTLGFPPILVTANGSVTFPRIDVADVESLGLSGWTKTIEAQTNFLWDAAVTKIVGPHSLKFGAEQRVLLSNFFQPAFPGGQFGFDRGATRQDPFGNDPTQGSGIASLLIDFGSGGGLSIHPSVTQKSKEFAGFAKDDWQVSRKLTLNLGLRYEVSTPYTDRHNRVQIADFTADSGINVPGIGPIEGGARFATNSHRHVASDWNNIAPRLGLAYRIGNKTVVRAAGGVYYGVNYATSYQDLGPAYRKFLNWRPSLDGGITRNASLNNPFPTGAITAQGQKYGILNMWGFQSDSNQSETFRNAEIYQWSFSVQRELPGSSVVEMAYSANRSTHLPFGGTKNRDFISAANRAAYGSAGLAKLVPNPFQPLFVGPTAIFSEPDSIYNNATIPQINLLRPYPQFDGDFEGFALFSASATYHAMQVKYEKRFTRGLNLVANYTLATEHDSSSFGSNGWLGNATNIQDLGNLAQEWSVGASDVRHRMVLGGSYELPFGPGKRFGANLNPIVNGFIGGWQLNGYLTLQTGLPLNVNMASGRLADGNQRPNVNANPRSSLSVHDIAAGRGNYFNLSAFSDPGDQINGNAPRFDTRLRGDGIRRIDLSVFKNLLFGERHNLQLRVESFNLTNTPRFCDPNTGFGDPNFGTISGQCNSPRQVQFGARFLF